MADKDKYALLRGKEHQNVFWTSNKNIDLKVYEVLYTGNSINEMVKQWDKYHPNISFRF